MNQVSDKVGEGGVKNLKMKVTSFMDGPYSKFLTISFFFRLSLGAYVFIMWHLREIIYKMVPTAQQLKSQNF